MASSRALLPSDDTVPSTPLACDNAIFSDEAHIATSPPSSPPGFPWEQQHRDTPTSPIKPQRPTRNAFSVLGKRKALDSISDNARSAKKPAIAPAKQDDRALTQMQISLGQEVQRKCTTCGMEYIACSTEDRKLHDKYHKQNAEGYDVGKDFVNKARDGSLFKPSNAGDTIVAIDPSDNAWRKKRARAALDVVQRELGAVEISDDELWKGKPKHIPAMSSFARYICYMYVRETRCVGFLLAEAIAEAHAVAEPASSLPKKQSSVHAKPTSALEALKSRRAASGTEPDATPQPISLVTDPSPADLGISRIWTSPNHRGQGIASSLLDTALSHHNDRVRLNNGSHQERLAERESTAGQSIEENSKARKPGISNLSEKDWKASSWEMKHVEKQGVAFSQPTEAGAKLARKWFGRMYGWLVYVD